MSFLSVVDSIICIEFEKNIGKNQLRREDKKQEGMLIQFNLNTDWHVEEGYRWIDILIYAPYNYVAVIVREKWNLISPKWVGENGLRKGREYIEGKTDWKLASYHDSCWRTDGVHSTLWSNRDKINCLASAFSDWYIKYEMNAELLETISNLTERNDGYHYVADKGVLFFNEDGTYYYKK